MIIYIDILFFENLILDFIILLTTKIICGTKTKLWKLLLGSVIGSLYTVVTLILDINFLFLKLISSLIIVFVSFGLKNKLYYFKHLGVFYLTTITFGGASLLFVQFQSLFKILLFGIVFGFILIVGVQKLLNRKFSKIWHLKIQYHGREIETDALVDSRKFIEREYNEFTCYYCRKKMFRKIIC